MKTLYLDCGMGAAGDMLTAALIELISDGDAFIEELNSLGIPGAVFTKEKAEKCGIVGTHIKVTVNGEEEAAEHNHAHTHKNAHEHIHTHSDLHSIETTVEGFNVSNKVKGDIKAIYRIIAEAESYVHGVSVNEIHFHEVGNIDAIADITAVCLLMEKLDFQKIIASPVHVGSGKVKCAHGILPVPAPATAYILKGIPIYGGKIDGELCTPTGAAILKYFASSFGDMPPIKVEAIGYGMGKKDFAAANCVRAIAGETEDISETVFELSCNIDDMTAEEIGFATQRLFDAGALDVFTVAIYMKKNRSGTLIKAICRKDNKTDIAKAFFRYTTTLGVREVCCARYALKREIETLDTPYGKVRRKNACGYGVSRSKYEYDDLAEIANDKGISLNQALELVKSEDK